MTRSCRQKMDFEESFARPSKRLNETNRFHKNAIKRYFARKLLAAISYTEMFIPEFLERYRHTGIRMELNFNSIAEARLSIRQLDGSAFSRHF
jgi:hypothetical protein